MNKKERKTIKKVFKAVPCIFLIATVFLFCVIASLVQLITGFFIWVLSTKSWSDCWFNADELFETIVDMDKVNRWMKK